MPVTIVPAEPVETKIGTDLSVCPTIFIGLGGTGGQVLLRLRRIFYEQTLKPGHGSVKYVYIDLDVGVSETESQKREEGEENRILADPKNRAVRDQIRFSPPEKVEATIPATLQASIQASPTKYPHMDWAPKPGETPVDIRTGAHGIRALGRLAFFQNFDTITKRIGDAWTSLKGARSGDGGGGSPSAPRFVVIAGLAGGTGSGLFLDLGFWLRHKYGAGAHIEGFFLLPDAFKCLGDNGYEDRKANGYAALKELEYFHQPKKDEDNSFRVQWEVNTGAGGVGEKIVIRPPAYTIAYLMGGQNEHFVVNDRPALLSVYEMMAEYLYWDMGTSPFADALRSDQDNVFRDAQKTLVQAAYPGLDGTLKSGYSEFFSARYMTLGLAKINYPLPRIKSLCAYRLTEDILAYWSKPKGNVIDANTVRVLMAKGGEQGFSANRILERLDADSSGGAHPTLRDGIKSKKGKIWRSLKGAIGTGVPRATLEDHIAAILQSTQNTAEGDPSHASRVIDQNRIAAIADENKRFRSWAGDLLEKDAYGPVGTRDVLRELVGIVNEQAAGQSKKAAHSVKAAQTARDDRQRALDYYDDVLREWNYHPFRGETLRHLAKRALDEAAREATSLVDQRVHEACARILRELAVTFQEDVTEYYEEFIRKLDEAKTKVVADRKSLDSMKGPHFFEVDLYERGDYERFYRFQAEHAPDPENRIPNFAKEFAGRYGDEKIRMLSLIERVKNKNLDIQSSLFAFATEKCSTLTDDKDVVAKFMSKVDWEDRKGWEAHLNKLWLVGRPWVKVSPDPAAAKMIQSRVCVGWPLDEIDGHPVLAHLHDLAKSASLPVYGLGDHGSGAVVILETKGGFSLAAIDGVAEWRKAYLAQAADTAKLGTLHLHPDLEGLPDLMVKNDNEAVKEVETRQLILEAIILGVMKRQVDHGDDGRDKIRLSFTHVDRHNPDTIPYPGEDAATQQLIEMRDHRTWLQAAVDEARKSLTAFERKMQLLAILRTYRNSTFRIVDSGASDGKAGRLKAYVVLNGSAVRAWYNRLYDELMTANPKENIDGILDTNEARLSAFAEDLGGGYWRLKGATAAEA